MLLSYKISFLFNTSAYFPRGGMLWASGVSKHNIRNRPEDREVGVGWETCRDFIYVLTWGVYKT